MYALLTPKLVGKWTVKECAEIDEVSIGHSLIVDALKYGFDATILKYINAVKGYGYY